MIQLLKLLLLILTIHRTTTQNPDCDYYQEIQIGKTYYAYSPNYNSNYPPGKQCRWIGVCPEGYNCRVDCDEVRLPQTQSCYLDRLLISKSGDPQLTSADYYCGTGSVSAVSTGQRIVIGLISARNSPGGRFRCMMSAQPGTSSNTCSCGYKKTNRIVGGQETGINEFPMMAGVADGRINQIKCGGVIISKRHVLTAAHCLESLTPATTAVVVGEHDVKKGDSAATKAYAVSSFNSHPQFTDANYDYDIAILTVSQDIAFSSLVGPVCLPFKFANTNMTGAKLTILGWGTLFIGGPTSDVLRKVEVDVISRDTCLTAEPRLSPRQICTYTLGKDACQDDSGGPLLYTDPATGLLFNIGIVSFGRSCANRNQPGINTDVPKLLNWIKDNTPGIDYCEK